MKYTNNIHRALFTMLFSLGVSQAAYALTYEEGVDDFVFSNDPSSPTTINFEAGLNTVRGSADNFIQGDGDFFTFDIMEGETLTAITLENYVIDFAEDFGAVSSFFGIGDLSAGMPVRRNNSIGLVPGDPNTSLFTASLFGEDQIFAPGEPKYNLLETVNRTTVDEEGMQLPEFLPGFNSTLGPGRYWVWISEVSDSIRYDLAFNIESTNVEPVPIPASVVLLAGPLGILFARKKVS